MKVLYYPGCVSYSLCQELLICTQAVAAQIDINLVEIPQASCCGAGYLNEDVPNLGNVINARTLAMAEQLGLDLVTGCSTCLATFKIDNSKLRTNKSLRNRANSILQEFELEYRNGPTVRHIAELFTSSSIADRIMKRSTYELHDLRIILYTGCHFIRPFPVNCDIDGLLRNLGAKIISCETWEKCCGFHTIFTYRKMSLGLVGDIIETGVQNGGNLIVTLCPLCHMAFDLFQRDARREGFCRYSLPVMHLPQVLGMAMGMSPHHLKLHRHVTSFSGILDGLKT